MDSTSNEQNWIHFLSSIDHLNKLPTNNLEIKTKSNIDCLSTKFAYKLSQKETEKKVDLDVSKNQTETPINKENNETIDNFDELTGPQTCPELFTSDDDKRENSPVDQTDTDKDVNEASAKFADANSNEKSPISTSRHIEALVGNTPLASGKTQRRRHHSKDSPSKKIPSSRWTISNIAEYFIFDECVTNFELSTTYAPCTDIYETAKNFIFCRLKRVKGIDLKEEKENTDNTSLIQLKSVTITEAGSRLVLDALLIPLCSALDLQIELEKNISCDFLPICTFDYCIRKGEHIIGCVDAKSVKCLNESSVAQAILQLMMLQATLEFPVFAIVTDGHRFIYIQLKGSFLGFEHNGDKLRIRKVREEGDFIDILQHITFLVKEFKALNEDDAILTD